MDTENPTLVTEAVAELIALGAAMAANNGDAFQLHNFRLQELGVSREDRIQAVNVALQVKMTPHRNLMDMAEGFLMGGEDAEGGCCGGGCQCEAEGQEAGSCSGDDGCACGK